MTSYSSGVYHAWLIFFLIPLAFFSLQHPASLTVAIDFGDKQPSKSHCMLPKISKLHDGLRQIAIYIYPWMSSFCDSGLLMPLYQMAGCKVDINWDKCLGLISQGIKLCHIATRIVIIFMMCFQNDVFFRYWTDCTLSVFKDRWRPFPSHTSQRGHWPDGWSGFSMSSLGQLTVW